MPVVSRGVRVVAGCAESEKKGRVDSELIASRTITVDRTGSVGPDYY